LFAKRIVVLKGFVTSQAASDAVAILHLLDTAGAEPVQLHLNAPDGDLNAVFAVIDAIELMKAPVQALVTVEVGGGALGILTAAQQRSAYPHARFRLAEPAVSGVAGTADEIATAAGSHLQALEDLVLRLAALTGHARSRLETDFGARRLLSATKAQEYGLVDAVCTPPAT